LAEGSGVELKPLAVDTRRGAILRALREQIVSGQLAAGTHLTEAGLAARLAVSRGPLREALRELVAAGLLISEPYRGVFVRGVSRRDVEELYSLRTTLEKMAFRLAWPRRDPAALEDLAARHRALAAGIEAGIDPAQAIDLELALHGWVYERADHRLLREAWDRLHPRLQFYFSSHQRAHGRSGPRRDGHLRYVTLAAGADLPAMEAHIDEHMRQGMARTLTLIGEEEPGADDLQTRKGRTR
jgi:DNA-binding GntR family transcriptional regulator